jgi:very-short-patch-repair endonuclease
MSKYYKFTDEDLENGMDDCFTKIKSSLEPNVASAVQTLIEDLEFRILESMVGCESPIERLMAIGLFDLENSYRIIATSERLNFCIGSIVNQYPIKIGEKNYKVDFIINTLDCSTQKQLSFIIECDGHDFHEKTSEQVRKDKERERNFIKNGYILIRFSGSEIFKDYTKCASEAFDIIFSYYKK